MKLLQLAMILMLPLRALSQEVNIEPNIALETFDLKELQDSSFHGINVIRHRYQSGDTTLSQVKVYSAKFNKSHKIIYELKRYHSIDSTITVFQYDSLNNLSKVIINEQSYNEGHTKTIKYFSPNGLINYEEAFYNNSAKPVKTKYYYNKKGLLIKTEIRSSTGSNIYLYKYNERDSLTRETKIENYNNKTDSIIYSYDYDTSGNLVRESKEPSGTYIKTFERDCLTGLRYERHYAYDSLGNRIHIFGKSGPEKLMGLSSVYNGRAYTKVKYNENGFLVEEYDSEDKIQETHVYNYYHYYQNYSHSSVHDFRESYDYSSKITSYLSAKSKLPGVINFMPHSYEQITFMFEYTKQMEE